MPLKLSIIGKAFSGKKMQAEEIAKKYNLKVYKPEELIAEAIEMADEKDEELNVIEEPKTEEVKEEEK